MKSKYVLIGCGVALIPVLGLAALIYGSIVWTTRLSPRLKTPAVLTGQNFLSKSAFESNLEIGKITDIKFGELDPAHGKEIGIAGTNGAIILDEIGLFRNSVEFKTEGEQIGIVDVDGDGSCEYIVGIRDEQDKAELIDHKGNILWSYGTSSGGGDIAAGDINHDGKLEFVADVDGNDIHLLDSVGKLIWQKSKVNLWHAKMLDVNQDGRPEILYSGASNWLTARDSDGNVLFSVHPKVDITNFTICRWPNSKGTDHILCTDRDIIYVLSPNGTVEKKLNAPDCRDSEDVWELR